MKKKLFTFTYRAEVKRLATVEADSEEEALELISRGEYEDEHDIDFVNMDDINIIEGEEL